MAESIEEFLRRRGLGNTPTPTEPQSINDFLQSRGLVTAPAVDTSTPVEPNVSELTEIRQQQNIETGYQQALREEQASIVSEANMSMEPETIREQAEANLAPLWAGRTAGFDSEPTTFRAPAIDVASPVEPTWREALSPQARVGEARAARTEGINEAVLPSVRRYETMRGLLSPEEYKAREDVTREDATEYVGFHSAVGQYVEDNPNAGLQGAIDAVRLQLEELPELMRGEMGDDRYYEGATEGDMGPNDPWVRAFNRQRVEGDAVPRLSDYQKEYLNRALQARQEEFYPDVFEQVDEDIPDYEVVGEEAYGEVEGGLTEEDLDYHIDIQRENLTRELEEEHGLDPLPFWTESNTEYVMSNMEELSEGWLWQKQYPDGATVEGPISWLVRSAFLVPNMAGTALYEGTTGAGIHPGMSREEMYESEATRMEETPLYEEHPYLRNIATGQSLTNDAYALYHYGPESVQKWAPLAGAVGFAGEVLLVPFDAGVGSLAKGVMAGGRTYQAQRAMGIGARLDDAIRAGWSRTARDLSEQAPGLRFLNRGAGDPTILLASQAADYLDDAQHINSWRRANPTATNDEVITEIQRHSGDNSRVLDEARVAIRDTGEIPVFQNAMTDEIDTFARQLDEVVKGESNNIPRRRELVRALDEEGYVMNLAGDTITMRSTTDEFIEAINEIGAARLTRRMIWDVSSETAVRVLGQSSVGKDLRLLTPRVAVDDAQVGKIIEEVSNDIDYKRLNGLVAEDGSNISSRTFQDLPLHKKPTSGRFNYAERLRQGVEVADNEISFIINKAGEMAQAGLISKHAYIKIVEELRPSMVFQKFGIAGGKRTIGLGGQMSLSSIRTLQTAMLEQVALSRRMGIATKAWDGASDVAKTRLLTPIGARNTWVTPTFFRQMGRKLTDILKITKAGYKAPARAMKSIIVEHAINTYRQSLHAMDEGLRTTIKRLKVDPELRSIYGLTDTSSFDEIMMAVTFGEVANRGQHAGRILDDIISVSILQEDVAFNMMNALDNAKFQRPKIRFSEEGLKAKNELIAEYYGRIVNADTAELNGIVREFFERVTDDAFAMNRGNFEQAGKLKRMQALSSENYADVMSGIYYKAQAQRLSDNVIKSIADELPAAKLYANAYDELGRIVQRHLWDETSTSALDRRIIDKWTGDETVRDFDPDVGDVDVYMPTPEALKLDSSLDSIVDFNTMIEARVRRLLNNTGAEGHTWEEAVVRDLFGNPVDDAQRKVHQEVMEIINDNTNSNGQTLLDIVERVDEVAAEMARANRWNVETNVNEVMGKLEGMTKKLRIEDLVEEGVVSSGSLQREMQRLILGEDAAEAVELTTRAGSKLANVENTLINLFEVDTDLSYKFVKALNAALDMATSARYSMMLGLRAPFHVKNNITAPAIIWGALGGADAVTAIKNYPKALTVWNQGRGRLGQGIVRDPAGRVWTSNELYDLAIGSGALRSQSSVILSASNMKKMMADARMTTESQNAFMRTIDGFGDKGKSFFKWFQDMTEYEDQVWRMSSMIGALERGDDPITALNAARLSLMDYQAMSPIERTISAKFMMFYAFTRANAALFLKNAVNNPKRIYNMYRAQQVPGLLTGRVDPVEAQFYLPDYTIPKVLTTWMEEIDGPSYYQTFGEIPLLEAMTMFAQMGIDLSRGNFKEAISPVTDKIDPTYRWGLDPVFEYKSSNVDERDMYLYSETFWDVIIGERPEAVEPYAGQGTYEGSVWKLSDEGMERYVTWREHWGPFFALQTLSNDWAPMLHNITGSTAMEGRRSRWGNVLGAPMTVGTIPREAMRQNIQRDILEQTEQP
jgi:hypothetical protein